MVFRFETKTQLVIDDFKMDLSQFSDPKISGAFASTKGGYVFGFMEGQAFRLV